jgi:hypothetical protein
LRRDGGTAMMDMSLSKAGGGEVRHNLCKVCVDPAAVNYTGIASEFAISRSTSPWQSSSRPQKQAMFFPHNSSLAR